MNKRRLKKYLQELKLEIHELNQLRIFDFDDTLALTQSKVTISHADGTKSILGTGEYAVYNRKKGDKFDFCQFDNLDNPKMIKWTARILKKIFTKHGKECCVILTARHNGEPIREFLHAAGFDGIEVVALASGDPQAKADWIHHAIVQRGLEFIEFFDDSHRNISAVNQIRSLHENVKIITHHIRH
jgi:hypothetical protein